MTARIIALPVSTWTRGRPPAAGWYVASKVRDASARRFYQPGRGWSAPVRPGDSEQRIGRMKATRSPGQRGVEWKGPPMP